MKKILLFLLLVIYGPIASAQTSEYKYDAYFDALNRDHQLNGNVAMTSRSRIIYERSFGYQDFGVSKQNDAQSQFELASVSKLFTATCILQLKDQGLLRLDDPFRNYFAEFPFPNITIRHLLSHTSGLPDTEKLLDSMIVKHPQRQFTIHDELPAVIAYSMGNRLLFEPGERWSYSSAGYHLLALLIEKMSGQSFSDYVNGHIFKPAGMRHTYLQTDMAQKGEPNRTKNYQYNNHFEMKLQFVDTLSDWKEWSYNLALMGGGGGVISTTGDMLRFDRALRSGMLLKKSTQEEAYAPYQLNNGKPAQPLDIAYCGLGWFIMTDTAHGRVVWGSGANPGTISFFSRNLDNDQCIVILHNIKSNGFQDLVAIDLLNGKKIAYKASLGFIYTHNLCSKGQAYADQQQMQLSADTVHYEMREADLGRASLELRRAGMKEQVLVICNLHVRLFPQSADAYRDRAVALAEYGQKKEAIHDYKQAIAIDPKNTNDRQALERLENN